MLLKFILNRVQLNHGFVYGSVRWFEQKKRPALEVEIRPRKKNRPACSVCGNPGPGYDTLPLRQFEFVPLWVHKQPKNLPGDGAVIANYSRDFCHKNV